MAYALTHDLEAMQPERSSALLPWLVCLSAALFFFYEFIQMNMFNAISQDLMRSFSTNGAQLGYLSATYFYADTLFLLPAGLILDRFSVRKVILFSMGLCVTGTLIFALATSFWVAAVSHFLSGAGNAFSFLGCIILASRWFPPQRMALVTGIIVTMAMAGGVVAQTPLTLLAQHFGWRNALLIDVGLGVIILSLIYAFVQNHPHNSQQAHPLLRQATNQLSLRQSLLLVSKNRQNWFCGLYTSLLNLPLILLGGLWGSLSLVQMHHLSAKDASYITSMLFMGTIIGAPLIGWLSDKVASRRKPMLLFAGLALVTMLILNIAHSLAFTTLLFLFLLLGFLTSSQVLSYPTIAESNSRTLTGTATGLASVLIMGGIAVAQPVFGYLLDLHWNGLKLNGAPIYSLTNFELALAMFPIALIVGIFMAVLIRETHCRSLTFKADRK